MGRYSRSTATDRRARGTSSLGPLSSMGPAVHRSQRLSSGCTAGPRPASAEGGGGAWPGAWRTWTARSRSRSARLRQAARVSGLAKWRVTRSPATSTVGSVARLPVASKLPSRYREPCPSSGVRAACRASPVVAWAAAAAASRHDVTLASTGVLRRHSPRLCRLYPRHRRSHRGHRGHGCHLLPWAGLH